MTSLRINEFDINTNIQHEATLSKEDGSIEFTAAQGEVIAKLLSDGARIQRLKKRPARIRNLPFTLSFNDNETVTLSRIDRDGKITVGWGEMDDLIVTVGSTVDILTNEIIHSPKPRGGHAQRHSFGDGDTTL